MADALGELARVTPRVTRLPTGLTVIAIELPHVHRVVIDTHLRVGSLYETPDLNGISHFLEHMLYRGTPEHPSAQALAVAFERLGGMLLAATATDSGSLSVSAPPENFEALFDLYAEVFQYPILKGIDVERGIVSQEILEGLDESGKSIDPDNLIRALAFPDHSLGLPITGTLNGLQSFDEPALRRHHQRHYTGDNAVMAIAGPISADAVIQRSERAFATLPRGDELRVEAPTAAHGSLFSYVTDRGSQVALRVAFRAPGVHSADEPAADLLLRLIDDGMSTRLYRTLCDDNGLCYDVSASYEAYGSCGLFEFRAETSPERAGTVLAAILQIARDLREPGPTRDELTKAQQRHRWQLREMLDSPESLTSYHALGALHRAARSPAERQQQLEALDVHAVAAAARGLFTPENLSVVVVGPLPRKQRDAAAQLTQNFR